MNKKMLAAGMLAATLLLSACAGGSGSTSEQNAGGSGSSSSSGDKPYIAIVSKGFQHQFWQAVKSGAEKAANEFDVTISFEGPDTETAVDQQIQMLQTALDKNPAAIGFAALDSQAAVPLLEQAKNNNIPVIAFDSGVDSTIPLTTAATDNKAAAAEAAKHMVEAIGGSGEIAMVVHDQTSLTGVERRDGFTEYIEKNAPKVKIVDVQYSGDQAKAADLAKAMINAHPNLKGIYGSNEGAAIGVVQAAKELNLAKGKLAIIGFDSGAAQVQAIRDGLMLGAITQNPIGMGYETVKAAVEALDGKKLPKTIDTGYYWYTAENIDDPEIAAVLYE